MLIFWSTEFILMDTAISLIPVFVIILYEIFNSCNEILLLRPSLMAAVPSSDILCEMSSYFSVVFTLMTSAILIAPSI